MTFTFGMQVARLLTGAIASLCAGFVAAVVAKGAGTPARALAVMLLLLFIPVHYALWDKFPVWYHLTFLSSLVPLAYVGGMTSWPAPEGR